MSLTLTHLGHSVTGPNHESIMSVPVTVLSQPLPNPITDPGAYLRAILARRDRVHALYERTDQLHVTEIFPANNYQNDLWNDGGAAKELNGFSLATPIILGNESLGGVGILMLYRAADGATKIVRPRDVNSMSLEDMVVPQGPTVSARFAAGCTSFVSGVFLGDTFPQPFVMAYRALDGLTQFHFPANDGSHAWLTVTAVPGLPAGIRSMAVLTRSREPGSSIPYLATVSGTDLVIHQLAMGVSPFIGPTAGVDEVFRWQDWSGVMNVQSLSSLHSGTQREHLVAYDPDSGRVRLDRVVVSAPQDGVSSGSDLTVGVMDSWPAQSLVATQRDRVLRYSPRDGSTDYYRL